jgi:hypothetical protein
MKKQVVKRKQADKSKHEAFRVRLPGFLIENETGLGDVIKRATSAFGIRPCSGCEDRAGALNRWVVFTNWSSR